VPTYTVCALYKFVRLDNHESLRQPLLDLMLAESVRGTLLLATEGVNGTIAGSRAGVDLVLDWLQQVPGLSPLECKESVSDELPFKRSRVKLKKEIVTMGVVGIDPQNAAGTYVEPEDWNALISDPEVLLIDTRNDYECEARISSLRQASFRQRQAQKSGDVLYRWDSLREVDRLPA